MMTSVQGSLKSISTSTTTSTTSVPSTPRTLGARHSKNCSILSRVPYLSRLKEGRRSSRLQTQKMRASLTSSKPQKKRGGSERAVSLLVTRPHASNSLAWRLQARSVLSQVVQVVVQQQLALGVP